MPYNTIDFGQAVPQQVPDYGQQDQQSLFQQIQQYQDLLAAQQEKSKQLGNNPNVLAGQYAGQNAAIAQQQSILNTPDAPMNNYVPDQNYINQHNQIAEMNKALALQAQTPGERTYYARQAEEAYRRANDSVMNTRILSLDEQQQKQEAYAQSRLLGAVAPVNAIPLEQGVNPSVLGQFGDLAQKAGQAGGLSRQSAILGQADIQKQAVANAGLVDAAQVKAAGDVAAARAQYGGEQGKLTKATRAILEQGVTAVGTSMNLLSQLGRDYDPAFSSGKRQALASVAGMIERWTGGNYDTEFRDRFAKFTLKATDAFNQYRKIITGASASEGEIKALKEAYFNLDSGGPVEQKARLAELLVQQATKLYAARKALTAAQQGIDLGIGDLAKPGTPEFGMQVDSLAGQLDPEELTRVRDLTLSQFPGLVNTPPKAGATANGVPATSEDMNARRARIAQELLSQQQQSQQPVAAQEPVAQPQMQQQAQVPMAPPVVPAIATPQMESMQLATPQQFDAVRNRLQRNGR